MLKPKQPSKFPAHAEHAANLERKGFYSEAMFAWTVASEHARKQENKVWALLRVDFCEVWATRYERKEVAA